MNGSKRIVITGASDGIGRAIAVEYARHGGSLLLVARRAELLEEVAADVRTAGGTATTLSIDVASTGASGRIAELAMRELGGIDAIIMNAGVGIPTFAHDFSAEDFERVMEINYFSIVRMIEAVLPAMLAAKQGHIVAVSSLAAYRGMPGSGAYNASKAAVTVMMESLRTELRASGVRFTTIAPGFVRTAMTSQNEFKMPFLMEPADAARRIVRAIERGRSEYSFPIPMKLAVAMSKIMPNWLYDRAIAWGRGRSAMNNE